MLVPWRVIFFKIFQSILGAIPTFFLSAGIPSGCQKGFACFLLMVNIQHLLVVLILLMVQKSC